MTSRDIRRTIRFIEENPVLVQLLCMIAIPAVLVFCYFAVLGSGNLLYALAGVVAIALLIGLIVLCGRMDPL